MSKSPPPFDTDEPFELGEACLKVIEYLESHGVTTVLITDGPDVGSVTTICSDWEKIKHMLEMAYDSLDVELNDEPEGTMQ